MGSGEISRSKDVTADLTVKAGKARKAGPKPWEMEKYIFKEEPIDEKRSSHCDPRLELVQQIHGQHQDSDFIPYDGDHGYGHPVFGATSEPNANYSTVSELGTLAGGRSSDYRSEPQIRERTNVKPARRWWSDSQLRT